jgi:hypothetical protein
MRYTLLFLCLCLPTAYAESSLRPCYDPSGMYTGLGYASDIRSDAAYAVRGHLYAGYRFCTGLQVEFRHTSALGSDDGLDLTGDNRNDIRTSENSFGLYYTVWFK